MLIPISHEDQRGRRWPYITIGIVLLNTLIFLVTSGNMEQQHGQYAEKAREAFEFYVSHPWLTPPEPLKPLLAQVEKSSRKDRLMVDAMKALHEDAEATRGGVDEATKAEQQAELDALAQQMVEAQKASGLKDYAYVPAANNVGGMITSQFLHGGWLHLIFNMWFLWLAGCNIEDRWGRLWFPLFYLASGVIACFAHKLSAPESIVPLIGASGAVAGAMGAFLMRFAKTQIRFLWIVWFRVRTFSAPAFLMLPLWLGSQVLYGAMYSSVGVEGGVAFWAHVGGFLFGIVFAMAFQFTGLEEKVDKQIEGQVTLKQDDEVLQATALIDEGQHGQAIQILEQYAAQAPNSVEAQLELLRASRACGDTVREKRAYTRLIALYLQNNSADTALQLYDELQQRDMESAVPGALRVRLAKLMEKANLLDKAAEEYCNIYSNGQADKNSFQALLAHANLALRMQRKADAVRLFTIAQQSPVPHLDMDQIIAHGLRQAQALPDGQATAAAQR